jgi:hypothetical protein
MSISREDEQWESEEREDRLLQEISDLKKQLANANVALLDFPVLLKELAEARAALLSAHSLLILAADWHRWLEDKHAAALKAAREEK